jgi:pimeloyl-ACP methyl ester carboxylesterase
MHITLPGSGLTLHADADGPQAGLQVVLLHGGGQTRGAWGKTVAELARHGCRAYAVDMRGHGESDWAPGGNYRIETYANDLREIVASFGRPAVLVGASLGGLAAVIAAGEAPQLAALGVVLVDVSPNLRQAGVDAIIGFMRATSDGFDSVEHAADAIAAYLPHRPRPTDLTGLRKNLSLALGPENLGFYPRPNSNESAAGGRRRARSLPSLVDARDGKRTGHRHCR